MKLEEGEKIIKILRRHYVVLIPIFLVLVFMALAPIIIYLFLNSDFGNLNENLVSVLNNFIDTWGLFAYSVFLSILWIIFFIEWTDYHLDLWVITDRRIIDAEQKGFFHREVTSFRFEQIQDITTETKGILETFLKYGDLHIQTAGHLREIFIKDADMPEEAKNLILSLQHKSDVERTQ